MTERTLGTLPASLTFTSDFHELLRGNLAPGKTLRLRYDPLRIAPPGEDYVFGDPARPIFVHARFGNGPSICQELQSAVGMLPDRQADITGYGNMLTATLTLPPDALYLEIWFSFEGQAGTLWDSDFGRNFQFGFAREQIAVKTADVVMTAGVGRLQLDVTALTQVAHVSARVHAAMHGAFPSFTVDLHADDTSTDGWRTWHTDDVAIPGGQIVRFKLYYWIGRRRYKDDNDGLYYLTPFPVKNVIPPPPLELAACSLKWA